MGRCAIVVGWVSTREPYGDRHNRAEPSSHEWGGPCNRESGRGVFVGLWEGSDGGGWPFASGSATLLFCTMPQPSKPSKPKPPKLSPNVVLQVYLPETALLELDACAEQIGVRRAVAARILLLESLRKRKAVP